jgi:pimeloyl-ACP methyl ester carboxylesterase
MIAISDDPKIASLYENVPEDQIRRLLAFREAYPYETMEIAGQRWSYIDTQRGEQVLFVLAGGTTIAEISFNTIEYLARKYRVIAPDYPPIDNLAELFTGCIEMLDRLGIGQFVLLGGSYGGWLAQSLVRYSPGRVSKLVLSAIGPPDPENSRQLAKMLRWLKFVPTPILRAMMNRMLSRLISDEKPRPEQLLIMAQLKEIMLTRVGRSDILAALRRLVDQTENTTFRPEDLEEWPGRLLVLMGSDDPSTPPEKREAMARLYPQAEVMVFEGADHTLALTHREAYYGAIEGFLAS